MTCDECFHFYQDESTTQCRRFPPVYHPAAPRFFPVVSPNDFCGEFEEINGLTVEFDMDEEEPKKQKAQMEWAVWVAVGAGAVWLSFVIGRLVYYATS